MARDPRSGINLDLGYDRNKYNERKAMLDQEPFDELGSMTAYTNALNMAAGMVPDAGLMMPEMVTEAANTGGGALSAVNEFATTNAALAVEHQAAVLEVLFEQMGDNWKEQKALWDTLAPEVVAALKASGWAEPSDPKPGGIQIPLTSILKRGANLIPGVDLDAGNIELNTGDNLASTVVNQGLRVFDTIPAIVREGGTQAFNAFNTVEEYTINRPLRTGQLVTESYIGEDQGLSNVAGGGLGAMFTDTFESAVGLFGGLFTGRSAEMWQLASEQNGTFRPTAVSEALEMVEGDNDLHQLALSYATNNGDVLKTIEEVTGQPPGSPQFLETYVRMMQLLDPESGDQKFNEAIDHIQHNKIGLGHNMAEGFGFAQGERGHGLVSAATELSMLMVIDPTMVAGKLNRVRKAAAYAVESGQLGNDIARARTLNLAARAEDSGETAQRVTSMIIEANGGVLSRLGDGRFGRLIIREKAQLDHGRAVDRVMQKIARAADETDTAYDWQDLVQEVPAMAYMRQELVTAAGQNLLKADLVDGVYDTTRVWDFMQDGLGRRALISGATGRDPRLMILPRITAGDEFWIKNKRAAQRLLRMDTKLPSDMADDLAQRSNALAESSRRLFAGEITYDQHNLAVQAFKEGDPRSVLKRSVDNWFFIKPTINRFIKHAPRNGYINTALQDTTPKAMAEANEGILEFERFMNYGDVVRMEDETKKMYVQAFTIGNAGERRNVVQMAIGDMMARSGMVGDSGRARDLLDKYHIPMNQIYGVGDDVGPQAVFTTQLSPNIAIPDFSEFRRAVIKAGALRNFGMDSFELMDNFLNKTWRRLILSKMSFIPRAAGDETAGQVLRMGIGSYARAQFGRRWAYGTTLDPLTGRRVSVRQLNTTTKAMRQTGVALQRMSRMLPRQIRDQAIQRLDEMQRANVRLLELKRAAPKLKPEDVARYTDEIDEILSPMIEAYRKERPAVSRGLAWVGQKAIISSAWASPRMYDAMRALKIPSRADIGRMVMGNNVIGFMEDGSPILREVPTFFGSRARVNRAYDMDQVDGSLLLEAERLSNHNPLIERIRAMGLGSTWDPYGVEEIQRLTDSSVMSREARWAERQSRNGKKLYIQMRTELDGWENIDLIEGDARRAIGNAFFYPANDPSFAESGAIDALASYIGNDTIVQLTRDIRTGGKFTSRDSIFETMNITRGHVATKLETDNDIARMMREAFIEGEAIPEEVFQAIPELRMWEATLNAQTPHANRVRGLFYPDAKLLEQPLIGDLDEALELTQQRMWAHMQLPSTQVDLAAFQRIARRNGMPIAQPLGVDQIRLYGVTVRPQALQQVRKLSQNPEIVQKFQDDIIEALALNGMESGQIDEVLVRLMDGGGLNSSFVDRAELMGRTGSDEFVPAVNLYFADPNVATEVNAALDDALRNINAMSPIEGDQVMTTVERMSDMGYIDVDNATIRNSRKFEAMNYDGDWNKSTVFSLTPGSQAKGVDLAVLDSFQRIDPAKHVSFHETADGRWISMDVLNDMPANARPEMSGRVQFASGMTEHAARREMVELRMQEVRNLFVTDRGEALTEVLGALKNNQFDPFYHTLHIPIEDLPANAYQPKLLEIDDMRLDKLFSGYFSEVVDPIITAVARSPLWTHNMAASLPMADDYYQHVVKGVRNDRVLAAFDQAGVDENMVNRLLSEIHYSLGPRAVDDESAVAMLMEALIDPTVDPEKGIKLLAETLFGDRDHIKAAASSMLNDMEQSFFIMHGREMTTIEEAEASITIMRNVKYEFLPVNELEAMRSELDEMADMLMEAGDVGDELQTVNQLITEYDSRILNAKQPPPPTGPMLSGDAPPAFEDLREILMEPVNRRGSGGEITVLSAEEKAVEAERLASRTNELSEVTELRRKNTQEYELLLKRQSEAVRAGRAEEYESLKPRLDELERNGEELMARAERLEGGGSPDEMRIVRDDRVKRLEQLEAEIVELDESLNATMGIDPAPQRIFEDAPTEEFLAEYNLTMEQWQVARNELEPMQQLTRSEALREHNEIEDGLRMADAQAMRRPKPMKRKSDSIFHRGGTWYRDDDGYDFFDQMQETTRKRWYRPGGRMAKGRSNQTPEEVAMGVREHLAKPEWTDEQAIDWVLEQWELSDALKSLAHGTVPKYRDATPVVLQEMGIDVAELMRHPHNAAIELARKNVDRAAREDAWRAANMGDFDIEMDRLRDLKWATKEEIDTLRQEVFEMNEAIAKQRALEAREAGNEAKLEIQKQIDANYNSGREWLMWDELQLWANNRYYRFQESVEQASVRATNMTVEFIDDHRFKSQFQLTVGNLMPFHFAEEQFIKRQIRMLVDTPESIRRASLLMNAARHSGLIDRDADGNEIFVYPGTEYINRELLKFAGMISGIDGLEVYAQPMSAQVEYMLPGWTSEKIEGGTGPFIGFSAAMIADRFPELEVVDRLINRNEVSQGREGVDHFVPPIVSRMFDIVGWESMGADRMRSAELRAIQMSMAAGTAPPEGATPSEKQDYLDDIRQHARIINIMDAALYLGSPLPSGSRVNMGDLELSEEFEEIVFNSKLPYQEGMALFFQLNPDATPFTVFGSESTTTAPIASTHEQYQFLNEYDQILTNYPLAAAYLMPPITGEDDDNYSRRAREEQFSLGLRRERTPQEFMDEIHFQQASRGYYEATDQFDRSIWMAERAGQDTSEMQAQRDMFANMYENMHPVFADQRASLEGVRRRAAARAQRDQILAMSETMLPDTEHSRAILGLMRAHQEFNLAIAQLTGRRDQAAVQQRDQLRRQFIGWAAQYTIQNPSTEPYFSSNIRWDDDIVDGGTELIFEIEAATGRDF